MRKDNTFDRRYINFPITILRTFPEQPKQTLVLALRYSLGHHMLTKGKTLNEAKDYLLIPSNWALHEEQCRNDYIKHHGGVQCGINRESFLFWLYDIDTCSEFEQMKLLMYLAAHSILGTGRGKVVRTNFRMLFSRMAGRQQPFASDTELLANAHPKIAAWYTTRKRRTLLRGIFELGICNFPGRGVWLAYGHQQKDIDRLVAEVECRRHKDPNEQTYSAMLKEAKAKANNIRPAPP